MRQWGGVIQVDKTTYNRIRNNYSFEPPASIYVKGKGEMVIYRLNGRISESAQLAEVVNMNSAISRLENTRMSASHTL